MRSYGVLLLLLIFGVVWVVGDEPAVPDLVGNWTGTSAGYHSTAGYFHPGDYSYVCAIRHQEGRVFNGTLTVSGLDPARDYPFSGVIAPDLKTLHIVEYGTGTDIGYLTAPGEMELVLLVNEKDNFSVLCSLRKEE